MPSLQALFEFLDAQEKGEEIKTTTEFWIRKRSEGLVVCFLYRKLGKYLAFRVGETVTRARPEFEENQFETNFYINMDGDNNGRL